MPGASMGCRVYSTATRILVGNLSRFGLAMYVHKCILFMLSMCIKHPLVILCLILSRLPQLFDNTAEKQQAK